MTATGTTKVWDLTDASRDRAVRRRGADLGGPVATGLGLVALGAALAPGLGNETRWALVIAAGATAVLVGFSALRRRQALISLLLAVAGMLTPLAAGAVTMDSALRAPAAVASEVVAPATLTHPADSLTPSSAFGGLPSAAQIDAGSFATTLVLRLRSLHGSFGPYPTSLALSTGSVVEGPGLLQGTSLGVVPAGTRLVYEVTSSGDAFRVSVVSLTDPSATVSATSALIAGGSHP
jgi:hypothetical protein